MEVTACIVTRGDVGLTEIVESIPPKWEVVIYDNSKEENDAGVFGRYFAILRAQTEIVYVQDDDCVLEPDSFRALEAAYEPDVLTANMPAPFRAHYTDSCLLGFGAIFDRNLPASIFTRFDDPPPHFTRVADVYFTALVPARKWVDVPYRNLPWATDDTRMYRQPGHVGERAEALGFARAMR